MRLLALAALSACAHAPTSVELSAGSHVGSLVAFDQSGDEPVDIAFAGVDIEARYFGFSGHGVASSIRASAAAIGPRCVCPRFGLDPMPAFAVGWAYRAAKRPAPLWFALTPRAGAQMIILDRFAVFGAETGVDFAVHTRRGIIVAAGMRYELLVYKTTPLSHGAVLTIRVGADLREL